MKIIFLSFPSIVHHSSLQFRSHFFPIASFQVKTMHLFHPLFGAYVWHNHHIKLKQRHRSSKTFLFYVLFSRFVCAMHQMKDVKGTKSRSIFIITLTASVRRNCKKGTKCSFCFVYRVPSRVSHAIHMSTKLKHVASRGQRQHTHCEAQQ